MKTAVNAMATYQRRDLAAWRILKSGESSIAQSGDGAAGESAKTETAAQRHHGSSAAWRNQAADGSLRG